MQDLIENIKVNLINLTLICEPALRSRRQGVQKLTDQKLVFLIASLGFQELDIVWCSGLPKEYRFICRLPTLDYLSSFCILMGNSLLTTTLLLIHLDLNILFGELKRRMAFKKHTHGRNYLLAALSDNYYPLAWAVVKALRKSHLVWKKVGKQMPGLVVLWLDDSYKLLMGHPDEISLPKDDEVKEVKELTFEFAASLYRGLRDNLGKPKLDSVTPQIQAPPEWEQMAPLAQEAIFDFFYNTFLPLMSVEFGRLPFTIYEQKKVAAEKADPIDRSAVDPDKIFADDEWRGYVGTLRYDEGDWDDVKNKDKDNNATPGSLIMKYGLYNKPEVSEDSIDMVQGLDRSIEFKDRVRAANDMELDKEVETAKAILRQRLSDRVRPFEVEKMFKITLALVEETINQKQAAKRLRMSIPTLMKRLKKIGLHRINGYYQIFS